ncbi:myosin heavy chain, striated muscle-like isoform X2 [Acropora muricata]
MLEEDFDKDAERAMKKATSQKQDKELGDLKVLGRRHDKEMLTRSLSYIVQREASGVEDQKNIEVPHGFELGTMVEVPVPRGRPTFGVIRWIGNIPQIKDKLIVGLELEQETSACFDGTFNGTRYFTCQSGRGFFCMLEDCRKDSRFTPNSPSSDTVPSGKAFGSSFSPIIEGITKPPRSLEAEFCGNMRGLQGHHNSCYLDATLYSMFAFSWVFDTLLHRKRRQTDLPEYDEVQSVLREAIVNPLRLVGFVQADRVLHLRELLDKLSSTAGLINEEKDPEEFLNSLVKQVLKADPFLHLKSRNLSMKDSEGEYFYQIITEKDDSVKIAQVQNILEDSFFSADIILSEVPSCLILQMPRFGSRYKMYDMILPNLELDVSYIVESVPRVCNMCGQKVAQYECKSCLQTGMFKDGNNGITSLCSKCNYQIHLSPRRRDHKYRPILVLRQLMKQKEEKQTSAEKQKMDLFAVVCIETSHYVAFVKCGTRPDSPWCFFDSMADRMGKSYHIPAVTPCPEAMEWLSKDPKEILAAKERGEVPEKVRRLLGDGYLCMYQNLDDDKQFEENASSRQSTSPDSTSLQEALGDIQQLKNENNRLKLEKCHWEKVKNDVQKENRELVCQSNSLQTDLRANESQVHKLETSLTTAQQALKCMQQLKILHKRLKLEKCQLEKEKNAVREEKDELVVQNNSLQTDLRAKEAQVHRLETSLATAQRALEDMQQLKIEHNRSKLEKCQLEKEKNAVREEKDELVVQNNSLQTDLRAKETQVHELETSLTTAQQALEDTQQLKILHKILKLEKCQLEKEKNAVREEKDELVVQNNSLQTDLRAKEAQVHRLETSLATAQRALEDMQQLKIEHNRSKLEKCQLEKEKNDVQEEKGELVVQNNSLQTDLRAKEAQVHRLETSLATAQRALEDMQQLKIEHNRSKLEKCQLEKEKNDVQEEKGELVVQNNSLQTDLRAKEAQVHRLETSLATAQRALEDMQQLKIEHNRSKLEKCQLEKEKNAVREEKDQLVVQNNSLQTDLRAKEAQVHRLETSLATAQRALEDMQQLKIEHNRSKLEKCQLEKEKNAVREEKDQLVVQNNSLQTDLRAKEAQVHRLETSLATAQRALEDMQQLKIEHNRSKLEKCQLEKEKNAVREEKDQLVVQNNSLQTDLRAKEAQVHRLETSLTTAQQSVEDMQKLKYEHNRLKLEKWQLEKEKNAVQEEKDELVVQNNSLQTNLRAKEAQVHRLETSLATSQRALEQCQESFDWVVSRDEVQITDRCLGVGGWGKVSLGTFRGSKVAVKEIHELIISPYNRRLFEREINIASKCRHPCLLQFIGATNDDGIPLFITELLDTSLRALLEQRQLADTEMSIISLDVSLALNYLHNMKPSPILHRDVSSANVLLWRQGDQWRGKLSDYGTADFVQLIMTRVPGAAIYSAPEAVSSNQTPKVDVFSFGVLLCEMCIREMPDPERRNEQVRRVRSHSLRNLVRECLRTDPAERPDMARIIQEIEIFKGSNSCESRVNSNSRQTAAAAVRGSRRISEAPVRDGRTPAQVTRKLRGGFIFKE